MIKRHIPRRYFHIFSLILTVFLLAGCGSRAPGSPAPPGAEEPDTEISDTDESGADNAEASDPRQAPFSHAKPQAPADTDYVFPDPVSYTDDTGNAMQRDGGYLYSYYNGRLIRMHLETEEITLIYQTASTRQLSFCLFGNSVYFVERAGCDSPDDKDTSLWRVDKDGKNLTLLQDDIPNAGMLRDRTHYCIDIYDGIIYLINYSYGFENGEYAAKTANLYFRLESDGSVSEAEEKDTLYGALPRHLSPVCDVRFPSFPYAMRNYGYVFAEDSRDMLCRINPVSGSRESLGISLDSYYMAVSDGLIYLDSFYSGQAPALFSLSDMALIPLKDFPLKETHCRAVVPAEQGFFFFGWQFEEYPVSREDTRQYVVLHILPDGTVSALLSGSGLPLLEESYSGNDPVYSSCFFRDHFYFFEEEETMYSLTELSLGESAGSHILGTWPSYPALSPAVITAESQYQETPIGNSASTVYCATEKLFLKEQNAADASINQTLAEIYTDFETYVAGIIQEEQEALEENPEWYDGLDYTSGYDFSLSVSLDYMDDDAISFCCSYYQYFAYAAHGYYWSDYYVFDRKTGSRLTCEDFVKNSASFLTVSRPYVEKMAEWDFDDEMLLEPSRFSLSEDGYTLYFAPYDIGCYASGSFLITIPYEAFEKEL